MCLVSRPSSALGLDEPGAALATPSPKLEKEPDVAALGIEPEAAASAKPSHPEEITVDAASGEGEKARTKKPAPELLTSEQILPPLPAGTCLSEEKLISADEVTGTPQQKDEAAGTSTEGILVTPPKWQYAIPTDLIEHPMLSSATLKKFQNTFKELYKFSTVILLNLLDI
jgi:hypothetical protein